MDLNKPEELRCKFWKNDIQNNDGIIWNQYNEIKQVLDKIDIKWVNDRLVEIKKHAIEQTDYYKNMDLNSVFPVVNKVSIMENYEAHKAKCGFNLPLHISSTSGSTGIPFSVVQDHSKRMRTIADLKVFGELCDYPSHECMVFFRCLQKKDGRTPEQESMENIYYVDSSKLDNKNIKYMIEKIKEKNPRIIFSYSSTIVEIAKYIKEHYSKQKWTLKSVLVGGEGLADCDRKLIEDTFGCKVYRRYSDMELGILGQDSGHGDAYLLNWGSYFFEVLKIDKDVPANEGEIGRIVITDLFNKALPMIRYDTGDLGVMEYMDKGKFPVLKEIYGRQRDCVYTTGGLMLSPAKISVSMWGEKNIKQWQFIQDTECSYTLKVAPVELPYKSELVVKKLKGIIGEDSTINVEVVDDIPVLSSNKRRAVICNIR